MTNSENDYMERLRAIVPLQCATKAIYYYSIGRPSLAVTLTEKLMISPSSNDHRELARLVELLLKKAQGTRDTGRADADALRAGNPTQRPYSDVLEAIEYGDVSSRVIRAIVALFAKNGFR